MKILYVSIVTYVASMFITAPQEPKHGASPFEYYKKETKAGRLEARTDTLYVLMHVPKTMGRAVWQKLEMVLPRSVGIWQDGCAGGDHRPQFCYMDELELCRNMGFMRPRGKLARDPYKQVKYISLMRNPVERVLSEYFYITYLRHGENPDQLYEGDDIYANFRWPPELYEAEEDLMDWVTSPWNSIHNSYTKALITNGISNLEADRCMSMDTERYYGHWLKYFDFDELEEEINGNEDYVQAAKEIINEKFFFIGVVDNMAEMYKQLQTELGWDFQITGRGLEDDIDPMKYLFKTVPQDIIDEIRKRNKLDIAMYDWVRANTNRGVFIPGQMKTDLIHASVR